MPLKSIVADEREENNKKNLAEGKRQLYSAIDKDPAGFCFVVVDKNGKALRGAAGMTGPGMLGILEMLKIDLALQMKMQEEAERAH